jgi:DNA-binding response OmpR family regulator
MPRAETQRPAATQSRLLGLRVCLVEDDANVLMATSALLEKWGCEVETHSEGLNVITDCDIIIADFDLGTKISGSECIAAIREQRGWEVPAMIMTGHEIERIRSMLTDMNISILAKPVRPPELRATLLELTKHFAR